jgi:aerobic-type carbon monoxide dehydrogenase small subunit (CoxS/CutS family)
MLHYDAQAGELTPLGGHVMAQATEPISLEATINGKSVMVRSDPRRTVLEVFREDLHLTGMKYGCGEAACGACMVLVNGAPTYGCTTPIGEVAGKTITTIEGISPPGSSELHPVQQAFMECSGFQCGYCTPGQILGTIALLSKNPQPDDNAIRDAMEGHICRCNAYAGIFASVKRAAELSAKGGAR